MWELPKWSERRKKVRKAHFFGDTSLWVGTKITILQRKAGEENGEHFNSRRVFNFMSKAYFN